MKKSLIAFAALAVVGAASAQSSVTVYGRMDAGVVRDSGGPGTVGSNTRIDSGVAGGTRLGFRGVEDLGGGLKANFLAETGFCGDSNSNRSANSVDQGSSGASNTQFCTGGNAFMGREARVGLSGGFGAIDLGRIYTPAFIVLTTVDPFGTGTAGQIVNLFDSAGGYAAPGVNSGNPRMNNTFRYSTPSLSGFGASIAYGLGEVAGNTTSSRSVGLNITYANGPVFAGLAYHDAKGGVPSAAVPAGFSSSIATGALIISPTPAVPAGAQDSRKNVLFGATYDFGMAKAHFAYGTTKNTAVQGLATAAAIANPGYANINNGNAANMMLGVSAPLGSGRLMASYVNHNDKGINNFDANQFGVGYMYSLSKRTSLYTAYAKITNKNSALYTVGNAGNAGVGNSAFNLGVAHTF